MSHPRHELDELLTHPVRFSIMALLATADRAEFRFVRDQVEVSDSMLSKQTAALERVGYVQVRKAFVHKRGRTWLALTRQGHRTLDQHLAALHDIVQGNANTTTRQRQRGGREPT